MKRLLVYATQLLETGGIESHVQEFCRNMSGKGVDIYLVVLNASLLPETDAFYKQHCKQVFFCSYGRSKFRLTWLLSLALKLINHRFDALYTNGQGNSPLLLSKLVRVKGPWVHHHHTAGDKEDQQTWTPDYIKTLQESDTVIACSQTNAADMSLALQRNIDTIPCFSREVSRTDLPKSDAKVRLGYYGRLIPEKGIDLLCKLSTESRLNEVEFHIWGEGKAYAASYFEQYPAIHYHGKFSGIEELSIVMGSLDGFLLLSTHPEGLPICLLEVMSAGLPWLATNRGGVADIALDPQSTRVIDAGSAYDAMLQAVESFADDIKSSKLSQTSQKELYKQKFSAPCFNQQVVWCALLELNKV